MSQVSRLATARFISVSGTIGADIALAAALYKQTGSSVWVGALLLIGLVVPAALSPVYGRLGDRHDRRHVLICSDMGGAACFAGLVFVSGAPARLALALVAAVVAGPFLATSGAIVPGLARQGDLARANARLAAARSAGYLAGPAAASLLLAAGGTAAVFTVNAASFLASALLIATLPGTHRARPAGPEREGVRGGLQVILADRTLLAMAAGFVFVDMGIGLVMPAEVGLAAGFGTGATGYAAIFGCWAAGGLLSALRAARVFDHQPKERIIHWCAMVAAVALCGVGLSPSFGLALAAFAAAGAAMTVTGIGEDLLMQDRVGDALRARVYAVHVARVQLSLAAAVMAGGVLADAVGPRAVFAIGGAMAAVGSLVLWRLRFAPPRSRALRAAVSPPS